VTFREHRLDKIACIPVSVLSASPFFQGGDVCYVPMGNVLECALKDEENSSQHLGVSPTPSIQITMMNFILVKD